MTINLLIIKY